ncbi:MAG: hypothetical protein AB1405_17140 [Bdellovibrionota bacterium]
MAERSRIALQKALRGPAEDSWKFLLQIGLIDKDGRVQMGPRRKRSPAARKTR